MLTSKKLELRRSEIRQSLAELANIETPSEGETRKMGELDTEYRAKEAQYRAALISEDEERRDAGAELETRSETEWAEVIAGFEMRQVALALDEGRILEGQTQEIVAELRSAGGYQGIPVPWDALEIRNTVAAGTPNPMRTAPIIERLFANSVAARMGVQMINVGVGEMEYPVTTSNVSAGWGADETADVPGPIAYTTTDRPLSPDHNLGINMEITRKAMKQSGAGLEMAVRRDMNGAISEAVDKAVFQGSGAAGQPLGVIAGAAGYGITSTPIDAAASYAAFRAAVVRFITANAASGGGEVNLLLRPEIFDGMDDDLITGTAVSEWDRLVAKVGNIVLSSNALAAPTGDPAESLGILTTSAGGIAPVFCGTWGAVDIIRDPYTKAKSGALLLTALTTMDVTVSRPVQTEILTGLQ